MLPSSAEPPEDEEILAAIRALQAGAGGDAFAVVFRRSYRSLFTFFANRPSLREEADDLAQATLWKAFERIRQYRFEARFSTWLLQIAENVWKNAVRDRAATKRGAHLEVRAAGAESPAERVADAAPGPEARVLAGESTRVLRRAIEGLPPGMRRCTELRLFADLTYEEIAELTGVRLNSVRSQLFEARQRLKPVLDEYFSGADV